MLFEKHAIDKIVRDSYPNLIIDQILDAIKKGVLKPGDALPSENELIQQFNVGRTSVREALAGLEYMNIIIIENGQIIINPNVQSFYNKKLLYHHKIHEKQHKELLEVRRILETEFARLAAQRATINDIKRLRQILRSVGSALAEVEKSSLDPSEKQKEEYLKLNVQFHMALAKATQNTMYVRIYEIFKGMMFMDANRVVETEFMQTTHEIFAKIVKSIEERDYQKAVLNMEELMALTKKKYKGFEEKNASIKE